ncbi:hypothetical protein ACQ3JU_0585 (plasmid) [Bradyrhizobium guangxiense]
MLDVKGIQTLDLNSRLLRVVANSRRMIGICSAACGPAAEGQAARTPSRNLPTSSLRRLLSVDSDCAADKTCAEADPVHRKLLRCLESVFGAFSTRLTVELRATLIRYSR